MTPRVFIIEGLDRLGKDVLIDGILNRCGFFQIIHFSKPRVLDIFKDDISAIVRYQQESFFNAMHIVNSKAKIIFNRSWVGEAVYSPLYRNFNGNYVFDYELLHGIHQRTDIRLILLHENMVTARHFVDDGQGLGPVEKRAEEQERFFKAFDLSIIGDKRKICVTDTVHGGFRPKEEILEEALA